MLMVLIQLIHNLSKRQQRTKFVTPTVLEVKYSLTYRKVQYWDLPF